MRALLPIALPDLSAADSTLSNEAKAGYLWEMLSYFGCHEGVEETVRGAAREAGFNELTYDAFVRRIERALEEAGFGDFDVVRKSAQGRAMYADAQARRYTDMEIRVVVPRGAESVESTVVFHAHKCVVSSASPLLSAMIEQRGSNMVGSDAMNDVYEIREIPVDVFRVCMEFMYTGEVRVDAPMEPDFVAGLVLAADRLLIADGLFPLIGRELLDEASAPRAIEAACMTHATRATRWLVDTCAVYIARSLARGMPDSIACLPTGAIYAIAGEAVRADGEADRRADGEADRRADGEAEKWTMRVGKAVTACTGMDPRQMNAHLIETGTPVNAHSGNYRATFEKIDATEAPVGRGRTKMSSVPEDGKHTFVFCVGQREYVACVRRTRESSAVRITVAFRSNEPARAPQLVTVRAAGLSTHAVLVCGREVTLEVPFSTLDPGGFLSAEVEADPLFAICSEVVRLTVQQGPEAVAIVAGLDSRVLGWILSTKSRVALCAASYEAILRELAARDSEDDRAELTKALVSGFGTNGVSMGDVTALLVRVPRLFDEDNERMLDVLVSYAVGAAGNEAAREQLMGLIRCMSDGIRKSMPKSKAMRIE